MSSSSLKLTRVSVYALESALRNVEQQPFLEIFLRNNTPKFQVWQIT